MPDKIKKATAKTERAYKVFCAARRSLREAQMNYIRACTVFDLAHEQLFKIKLAEKGGKG